MKNLDIYSKYAAVPENAKRQIQGGKLKGKTDINPMWRIKCLTEEFGPVGMGWFTEVVKQEMVPGANGEVAVFVHINLYVKYGEEWSKPIYGTGGSAFVATEKGNLCTSDEAYKMAYTDAISVACKALGIGSDVYWNNQCSKYSGYEQGNTPQPVPQQTPARPAPQPAPINAAPVQQPIVMPPVTEKDVIILEQLIYNKGLSIDQICMYYKVPELSRLTPEQYANCLQKLNATPQGGVKS